MSDSHVPRHIFLKQGIKMNPKRAVLAAAVSLALVSGAVSSSLSAAPKPTLNDAPHSMSVGSMSSFANLIEAVKPAVVNISTNKKTAARAEMKVPEFDFPSGSPFEGLFRRFFDELPEGVPEVRPKCRIKVGGLRFYH